MQRSRRSLFCNLTAVGLAAYLTVCFLGHAGYLLCAKSDGRVSIEAASLDGCDHDNAEPPGELSGIKGCNPCDDASLTGDFITRDAPDDRAPFAVGPLGEHHARGTHGPVADPQARTNVCRDAHLLRSTVLLI